MSSASPIASTSAVPIPAAAAVAPLPSTTAGPSDTPSTAAVHPPQLSVDVGIAKLGGRDWWDSIGRPKYTVAPMVDQSELAWRILSRLHGATLAYTPMFHAALFSSSSNTSYAQTQFDTSPDSIEGVAPYDRPLVVQFCANDKDQWLKAAEKVVGRCDAVDLNLGCPQGIAKKGRYGSFLMEEWDLIGSMISHLHAKLHIPVIAKIRVFPSLEKTLSYASHIFSSGAQLVTVHGRTREAKGRLAGLASWPYIAAVRASLPDIPLLANGGLPSSEEIEGCLEETKADGVMSAEGNLYNPMLFSPQNAAGGREYRKVLPETMRTALDECDLLLDGGASSWDFPLDVSPGPAYAPAVFLASQYLAIVRTLPSTVTASSAIKAHLFKLFRPIWAAERHLELRDALGRCGGKKGDGAKELAENYGTVVEKMKEGIKADLAAGLLPADSNRPLTHQEVVEKYGGVIPYSHAQPYLRVSTGEPGPEVDTEGATIEAPESEKAKRPRPEEMEVSAEQASLPSIDVAAKKSRPDQADLVAPKDKIAIPCTLGSTLSPPCINSAAVKCSHQACMACCVAHSEGACGFHAEKVRKEEEKAAMRREWNKEKKKKKQLNAAAGVGKGAKAVKVGNSEIANAADVEP